MTPAGRLYRRGLHGPRQLVRLAVSDGRQVHGNFGRWVRPVSADVHGTMWRWGPLVSRPSE